MLKIVPAAIAAAFLSTAASAATYDAFDLDVTNAAGTNAGFTSILGQMYRLTVSGTFSVGDNPTRHVADAEYFNLLSDPLDPLDRTTAREIGVGVDGVDIDFGAYDPTNIYSALIVGTGNVFNVFYSDNPLSDNSGLLKVQLSAVPLPAGLPLLLVGLGVFGIAGRRKHKAA